ncbi:hypothetical protein Tco_0121825 [Tanacetum coccineum]
MSEVFSSWLKSFEIMTGSLLFSSKNVYARCRSRATLSSPSGILIFWFIRRNRPYSTEDSLCFNDFMRTFLNSGKFIIDCYGKHRASTKVENTFHQNGVSVGDEVETSDQSAERIGCKQTESEKSSTSECEYSSQVNIRLDQPSSNDSRLGKLGLALLATKEGSLIGSLSLVCSWTNGGGWMSSVLGSSVSFVTSLSFSTPRGEIVVHCNTPHYEFVIALASFFLGFGMVIACKGTELEGWLELPKSSNLVQRLVNKLGVVSLWRNFQLAASEFVGNVGILSKEKRKTFPASEFNGQRSSNNTCYPLIHHLVHLIVMLILERSGNLLHIVKEYKDEELEKRSIPYSLHESLSTTSGTWNLRHLDRLNSKNCKKYRVGVVPRSHGEDIDEGVL